MALLGRLRLLVKSWLHAFFSSAEDPRHTFGYAHQRQRELLVKVQQALVDLAASKRRLEDKTSDVRTKLPQLEEQARRAIIADRDDLARMALQRRQVATLELQTLQEHVRQVELEESRLSLVEQRLSTQIEAFFARQEVIAARYSAAEAQVRINEALGGVSEELADLGRALEKAEQTAEHMQARASALDELVDAGILETPSLASGDAVERQLAQLDVVKVVDAQLASLKQELKRGGVSPR